MPDVQPTYDVEPWRESSTPCECCGHVTRSIWGIINRGEATVAAYWVRWTEAHLAENGADFEFVIGPWGEGTSGRDRLAVKMLYRLQDDGPGAVMVVDACKERYLDNDLASQVL